MTTITIKVNIPLNFNPRLSCLQKQGIYKMINVIAFIHIKEGQLLEFINIFKSNIPNVIKEKGCIEYLPTVDVPTGLPPQELNSNVVTILEKWESLEDLQTHLSAPHMLEYREQTKNLVEKMSVKVLKKA
ncbi:putative quinol monooxygenase [Desulfobacterales bacterium HSG17]|nr:putative quinol monooxygenase [Desulfobacterales bacterium HSG17]